jgi:hypothetical protein
MMANGPITWRAKTLKRVSTSTAETEYIAVYEAGRQTKWLIQWLQEVEIYEDLPFEIKCDNTAAITLSGMLADTAVSSTSMSSIIGFVKQSTPVMSPSLMFPLTITLQTFLQRLFLILNSRNWSR